MLTLIKNGGYPMVFIVVFGLIALAVAARSAWLADRKSVGFVRWMMGAVGFATLNGTAADMGATLSYVARHPGMESRQALMEGMSESMSPGILGFGILAVVAVIMAVGQRRIAARE